MPRAIRVERRSADQRDHWMTQTPFNAEKRASEAGITPVGHPDNPVPIAPGMSAVVVPKNPLASTSLWGVLLILVRLGVDSLVRHGKLPAAMADATQAAVVEVAGWVFSLALILWGRWHATRPLGVAQVKEVVVK